MTSEREKRMQERENLRNIITQWNANRLDLFELSEPNEELEFHGVMRFYFQDSGQKVATKCIRVSSTAASRDVIHTLIEKFRPDIRMLSIPEYALYEIHENGEERKLGEEEKPLLVQLNWHKDDREGRFLLRRMDEKSILPITMDPEARSFRRKLSKREKKEKKKKEKKEKLRDIQNHQDLDKSKDGIAEKLYSELPETSFTRSISNPEAVMRRRRQQKLEKKLQQFRQEGGPEAGGTLRIFGETLNKDVPYKTLLLSTRESAAYVVKEILDKYGMDEEDSGHYCLVQVIIPHPIAMGGLDGDMQEYHRGSSIREYILDDDDCPLSIEKQHNRSKGILTFHIRRRPADYQPRKRKKKPKPTKGELDNGYKTTSGSHHHHHHHNDVSNNVLTEDSSEKLPYLLELNPDGSEVIQGTPKKHRLYLNVTEVGSERSSSAGGQHLQLFGPNVQSRHCVIAHTEGIVTVTPSSRDAETYVNGVRIYETTILQHGVIVRIGKLHTFRFVDPLHDERRRMSPDPRQAEYILRTGAKDDSIQSHPHSVTGTLPPGSYETTFDADGNVETVSTHSRDDRMSRKSDDLHSHRSFGREGAQSRGEKHEPPGPLPQSRRGNDPILPAVLEFWEEGEDAFLNAVIGQMEPSQVQFKLAPTYILYMAARYRASTHYRPEASPGDRAHRLTSLMIKIAGLIHQVIQDRYRDGATLAFWLANASELLHFLKQDRHVCAYTLDAQDLLAESVQLAFRSLVTCQQVELQSALPTILEDRDDLKEEEGTTADVLAVLSSAMSLLRRCRVNAALTIQLFSQLFHHINMWLFNRVILGDPKSPVNYCSALWGVRLKRRLVRIEVWAEKQGLELAADCHLSRIVQAAQLLQAPKCSPEDVAAISSACFKLNSWQIQTLLEQYKLMQDEPPISREVVEGLIKSAQSSADELARSDGREVRLEEDPDLQLPFLLPEDGYSCDIIRGVPAGMQDYLQPLLLAGLCRLTIQPTSSGYWTIYMSDQDVGRGTRSPSVQSSHQGDGEVNGRGSALPPHHNDPEVVTMKLQKSNSGMGLSIVAARGVGQEKLGIYIKSVVKGGAADQDGKLQAGDQLLKVDGNSLVGISQEKAAELMTRTGPVVTLEVAKQGAIYHGLAALLSQPSPVMQRGGTHPGPRRMSERDIPGRVVQDQNHVSVPRMQGSKSVPSLNSDPQLAPVSKVGDQNQQHYSGPPETHARHKSGPSQPSSRPESTHPPYDPRYQGYGHSANPLAIPGQPPGQTGNPPPMVNGRHPQHFPQQLTPQQQQALAEERHYQNIGMYQQAGPYPPHQRPQQGYGPQVQQPMPQRSVHGSHSSLLRTDPAYHHHHHHPGQSPQQAMSQSPLDRSRPLSTLVSPREQEQYVNSLNYNNTHNRPNQGDLNTSQTSSPHHRGNPSQPSGTGSWPRQESQRQSVNYGHRSDYRAQQQPDVVEEPDLVGPKPGVIYGQVPQMDSRQRDLLRQEAKMEEMREEVRRREERGDPGGRVPPNAGQPNWPTGVNQHSGGPIPASSTIIRQGHPTQYATYGSQSYLGGPQHHIRAPGQNSGPPPPTVPKPRSQMQQQPWPPNYEGQPDERHMVYRDSPPPPPPPSSTHPLMQHGPGGPSPAVSYRYGPSGYPPRPNDGSSQDGPQLRTAPQPGARPIPGNGDVPRAASASYGKPSTNQSRMMPDVARVAQVQSQDKKDFGITSPSPWEREEKEKAIPSHLRVAPLPSGNPSKSPLTKGSLHILRKQKLDEARRIRDRDIKELESLPNKTQKQEDCLRALRLEQEFQRRAEEMSSHGDDDDDDDELLDRAENRERILRMQEDLARTRQRRLDWEQEQLQQQASHKQKVTEQPINQQHNQNNRLQEEWSKQHNQDQIIPQKAGVENVQDSEGRLRHLRLEEVTRKKELEATKEAEERLLREARRRQEEDYQSGAYIQSHKNALNSSSGPQRLDTLLTTNLHAQNDIPPALPTSPPPPLENEYNNFASDSGTQRLESLVMSNQGSHMEKSNLGPPQPPERKASYDLHNTSQSSVRYTGVLRNGDLNHPPPTMQKKVSFHDSRLEIEINERKASLNNESYTLDDIDEVLDLGNQVSSACLVLNSSGQSSILNTSTGSTPGVIGAQEVYRDPRQRIEAERYQSMGNMGGRNNNVGPEKLSFREKMKMFALETGQDETPKDKVKISRAQREIETKTTNNGAVVPQA